MDSVNYKTLMKEKKIDTNRWKDITCPWMGRIESILIKNQYNQNDYITQGNLHIQCNSNSMQFKLLLAFFTELEPKKKI